MRHFNTTNNRLLQNYHQWPARCRDIRRLFVVVACLLGTALLVNACQSTINEVEQGMDTHAQAGRLQIDIQDPHRFYDAVNNQPVYIAGYYPSIAGLTLDQHDATYYRDFIDKIAANSLNYFRNVFNMGQPYNGKNIVYQRTGPGMANDSLPKVDITKFNQSYFDYWRDIITYAGNQGIYIQLTILDSWHNKEHVTEDNGHLQNEWGMKHDFYHGPNNINGIDTQDKNDWHNRNHPVFALHQAMIREVVNQLGDLPNIVYEISNENFTDLQWERDLADYLTQYELSKGLPQHLVMPRDLPNHSNVGGSVNDVPTAHEELLDNYGLNQPLIADNDNVDLGADIGPDDRRKKAWAVLTAGGHINYFHWAIHQPSVLHSRDVENAMKYIGLTRIFIERFNFNLPQMQPADNLVTNGAWAYAEPGKQYIIYLINDGILNDGITDVSQLPENYTASWFNPRDGSTQIATTTGNTFTVPGNEDWVLAIVSQ